VFPLEVFSAKYSSFERCVGNFIEPSNFLNLHGLLGAQSLLDEIRIHENHIRSVEYIGYDNIRSWIFMLVVIERVSF
jgi:hypothetical protein